ncbi:HU family DNA-binding protein [Sphaerisporangium sp. TRM90804]|uniref:HU family DNA-binding protein n=1 Tax=Sphaerisporangium sp. TRM90804 TaxID=3031113 RepID=UPI0024469EE5|nr:HU family DNA-binding protein [Sphaerisporangium sp. TRM90804]MDH2425805.1 HU family DNA-binding protein [Sphaerisporangium sp. TRM90804]
MTKTELVTTAAAEAGLSQDEMGKALAAILGTIQSAVASGEPVELIGFGTFKRADRKARKARNPQTGEPITVPARRAPAFKAGATFKTAVA